MKKYNIFVNENSDLEIHLDDRGRIADAFFGVNIKKILYLIMRNFGILRNLSLKNG